MEITYKVVWYRTIEGYRKQVDEEIIIVGPGNTFETYLELTSALEKWKIMLNHDDFEIEVFDD